MANKRLNIFIFEQAHILSVQHFAHTHSRQSKLAKTATTFTFFPKIKSDPRYTNRRRSPLHQNFPFDELTHY